MLKTNFLHCGMVIGSWKAGREGTNFSGCYCSYRLTNCDRIRRASPRVGWCAFKGQPRQPSQGASFNLERPNLARNASREEACFRVDGRGPSPPNVWDPLHMSTLHTVRHRATKSYILITPDDKRVFIGSITPRYLGGGVGPKFLTRDLYAVTSLLMFCFAQF